jgi:hypothetical protein
VEQCRAGSQGPESRERLNSLEEARGKRARYAESSAHVFSDPVLGHGGYNADRQIEESDENRGQCYWKEHDVADERGAVASVARPSEPCGCFAQ